MCPNVEIDERLSAATTAATHAYHHHSSTTATTSKATTTTSNNHLSPPRLTFSHLILLAAILQCNAQPKLPDRHEAGLTSRSLMFQAPAGPDFDEPIGNHSVAVGRDAQLSCKISNLGSFRTAWLRVEDKGILTIQNNVITRNYRIVLGESDDPATFVLTIKNVQPSDRGGYMCQINSVPMKYAIGYLDVLTPPVFDAEGAGESEAGAPSSASSTSPPADSQQQDAPADAAAAAAAMAPNKQASQVTASEGSNATLACRARGHPSPSISWRREDGQPIQLGPEPPAEESEAPKQVEGNSLSFGRVTRMHSGAYLCIANNGVLPSASKRQVLDVQFRPIIRLPQAELKAALQQAEAQLECIVELNPLGSYHWVKVGSASADQQEADDLWLIEHDRLMESDKYEIVIKQAAVDKVHMLLNIRHIEKQDFGSYKCIASNSLGIQSSAVRLSEDPSSSLVASPTRAAGEPKQGATHDELQAATLGPAPGSRQRPYARSSLYQPARARSQQQQAAGSGAMRLAGAQISLVVSSLACLLITLAA